MSVPLRLWPTKPRVCGQRGGNGIQVPAPGSLTIGLAPHDRSFQTLMCRVGQAQSRTDQGATCWA
jgi:hypothetical protein